MLNEYEKEEITNLRKMVFPVIKIQNLQSFWYELFKLPHRESILATKSNAHPENL